MYNKDGSFSLAWSEGSPQRPLHAATAIRYAGKQVGCGHHLAAAAAVHS